MFKNLRIGIRLGVGFGVVLLLMAIVTALSYTRLHLLAKQLDVVVNDKFPKTVWSNDIIDNVNLIARASRNALLLKDPNEANKELERIAEARKLVAERLAQLQKAAASDTEKKLLDETVALRQVFVADGDKFITMVKDRNIEAARPFLLTVMRKSQLDYMNSVEKLIDYQTELMEKAGKDAEKLADDSGVLIVSLALLAFAIGAALAY
ncbi:MCP four helix bundle domain-containing protein [Candidatus Accumulibacter vicinus]|uniref:Four helix bundle sensory module for signal transduction n=1 Tax=Candidatus Accumulibacter vicinus TaxID=2954382 RepID=A0A084XV29_9PROT|nr:MCP four helix bundle domain-containing protein [Candidatus Accumulibacter vicinus]KFB66323.1 MAG: Four helix bundle sensory module for signal transduction [Candidatus Accumulibacter vicinus]